MVFEGLVSVGLDVATSSEDVKICHTLHADSFPNHHTTASPAIHLMDTTVGVPATTFPPHPFPPIGIADMKCRYIYKGHLSPMTLYPSTMPLRPLNLLLSMLLSLGSTNSLLGCRSCSRSRRRAVCWLMVAAVVAAGWNLLRR